MRTRSGNTTGRSTIGITVERVEECFYHPGVRFPEEAYSILLRRTGIPIGVVLSTLLVMASAATASSPCAPVQYAVSSSGPRCNVTIRNDFSMPIGNLWWLNNTSGSYEEASSHLGRTADSSERITYLDEDGGGAISPGDVIEIYSGNGCGGNLPLILGPDSSNGSPAQTLVLNDGYVSVCGTGPQDPTVLIIVVAVALAAAAATILFVVNRRRHG